jgi:DNA uptake protein ComE-like DNA-binding protein
VLAKMTDLGMEATDDELKQVLDYFSDKFKGEASKPLNLNSAASVELESIVTLLRKEAAAWIAYRKFPDSRSRRSTSGAIASSASNLARDALHR